jgi:hypothetical protein
VVLMVFSTEKTIKTYKRYRLLGLPTNQRRRILLSSFFGLDRTQAYSNNKIGLIAAPECESSKALLMSLKS